MMKMVLGGVAAVALLAGSAHATTPVQFYSFGANAPTYTLISDFSHDTANASPTDAGFSGTAVVLGGNISGVGAEPATAPNTYGSGNYLSVENGQTETVSLHGAKHVEFYIGSLDNFNSLSFTVAGSSTPITYDGNQLAMLSGADNGAQTMGNTNGAFVFNFDAPVTSVTLGSTGNSFEIASISAPVPEPASWGLMIAGLGLVGGTMRARRKQETQAAVA